VLIVKWSVLGTLLLAASTAEAGNWPQWRGPFFNGSTDEKGLPSKWSKTENIAWSAALPAAAASTPIVWDNRVFLSGVDAAGNKLVALCFDRVRGRLLWSRDVASGISRDSRSNYANGSPVTDGKVVIFLFASGQLVAFDLEGRQRWARNIPQECGPWAFYWTPGFSPLLFDGKLYLQVVQRDVAVAGRGLTDRENESYLLALDPATGRTLWRQVRRSRAKEESQESHTTPIPALHAGQKLLLLAGGDALSGHDAASGKELWRWDEWNPSRAGNWPLIASPVAGNGVALVCVPKGQPVYAVKLGGSGKLDRGVLAWTSREAKGVTSEVPTPAYYDGDFFVLSDSRNRLSRVDSQTGKVKWSIPAPARAKCEASPLAGDGKIYLVDVEGRVAVVGAARGETIHVVRMDEPADNEMVRASIIAAHGQLFIRTTRRLYCVGKAAE
jgi:outer membrane protein assembly factor BamB